MELYENINILYSNSSDEDSVAKANEWLIQWQKSLESYNQIIEILNSCEDEKLVIFSLITIKNKIKYSGFSFDIVTICEILFRISNEIKSEKIRNLAINCLAGICNISESAPTIDILIQLSDENFYTFSIEYMDYFIKKLWRPANLYEHASKLFQDILIVFIQKLSENGFVGVREMDVIIQSTKSIPDELVDYILKFIDFIKQGFYANTQITSKIAEYINAVSNSIYDSTGEYTTAILEMTYELSSSLAGMEESEVRDNGIMELFFNAFLMNSEALHGSDTVKEFCIFALNLASQISFENENWPLLIDSAASFVSFYIDSFDQDVPRFLFEIAVSAVNEGISHTQIKTLFNSIFILCQNDLSLITDSELSVGIVAAVSYIGQNIIPIEIVESICEQIASLDPFPESILFIKEIGYITKEHVSETLGVLQQVFEADVRGASKALLRIAKRNRGKLDKSVSVFFEALELEGSFNNYLVPALINLMCNHGVPGEFINLIIEYLQNVISESLESNLAQLDYTFDVLEMIIYFISQDFIKLTPEVKELVSSGYLHLAETFKDILHSNSNSIQIHLSKIIGYALESKITEPRQEHVEWVQVLLSQGMFLLSHIQILKYISNFISPGLTTEYFDDYVNRDDDEIARILMEMSKFGDNCWNVFGSSVVCYSLQSKGILFKYVLKILNEMDSSQIPKEISLQICEILNQRITEGNFDGEIFYQQSQKLISRLSYTPNR